MAVFVTVNFDVTMANRIELCSINMAVIQVADAIASAKLTAEEKSTMHS